ncbi:uncharacterized protein Z519_08704 [Cladophialophora bantiana CBS 173.52]|uniref:Uncharacterized protein n=1 Tax=Cladophialophora bantiana (strain ATCC 10958 / CBS 173.52 / CDC B-1940 / NIH 8579) TaxID=1442370 RepID=A0A0D2ELS0_CLAB1|nr:uncharacterized protein Z519_08704 [Cladophialophora bantiana CBS 173.52]KIW90921.1 hypothetical protein Z519_08704 [Cladophialophora bantiana CBS 173.52]
MGLASKLAAAQAAYPGGPPVPGGGAPPPGAAPAGGYPGQQQYQAYPGGPPTSAPGAGAPRPGQPVSVVPVLPTNFILAA